MKKVLLISPHFDDAVLSAGQFMADRPDCEVVTVFGGLPPNPDYVKTPYDQQCGFDNARNAQGGRILENDHALALLKATALNLDGFPDYQYGKVTDLSDLIRALEEIIKAGNYEMILAPLGLGHPDHLMVTDAVIRLDTELPIWLWEDLPLRVVEPELVWPRLAMFGLAGKELMQHSTTPDKMAKKIRAMLCYKSQVGTGILDPYVMYVPERMWKLK